MFVSLANVPVHVIVAFSQRSYDVAYVRHGKYDIVMTWEEFKAWGLGVTDVPEAERVARMKEALAYFCQRQRLNPLDTGFGAA